MNPTLKALGDRIATLRTGDPGVRTALAGKFKAVEGDAPVLTFVGSDESVDRYGDVVVQAGINLTKFRLNPVVPDCHDYSSIAKILGTCDRVEVKEGKLVNDVRFATDNPLGLLAYKMAKAGHLRAQSIGFLPQQFEPLGQDGYRFTKSELLEISLVVVPANANAVAQMKSAFASGAIDRGDLANLQDFLQQLSQTKQTPATPDPAPGGAAPVPDWLPSLRAFVEALKTR